VRRAALLTTTFVLVMIGAACRDDGRTLREPKADQNQSISTLAPVTDPVADSNADVVDADVVDAAGTETTLGGTSAPTLPPSDEALAIAAPWAEGGTIDPMFTCDGANVAPALSWGQAPEGTLEIAITMVDMDFPTFGHWVMAGLDPGLIGLGEGDVPLGAVQATNGTGDIGYTGPCPPAGSTHTYQVTVHYLGQRTELSDGAGLDEFTSGIRAAEIASANVNGYFSRG
jgi:Raf kinase inhibitor-like YbhB/YbcL family protein